jgi:hypothetical protein
VTLMTLPKGKSFNWSTLAKRKNWYKKYGVSRLTRVRSGLVKAGEIGFDEESGTSLGLVTIAQLEYLSTVTLMTCARQIEVRALASEDIRALAGGTAEILIGMG